MSYIERLESLEKDLKRAGYSDKVIKEIENSNGAKLTIDKIDNLEAEMSYWND